MRPQTPYEMVREFHAAFGHPIGTQPNPLTPERVKARLKWMREELDEFEVWASRVGDPEWNQEVVLAEMYDAMIDEDYFVKGTLVEMGLDPDPGFGRVHYANMAKLHDDGNGGLIAVYDDDGKVIKPKGWVAPSHVEWVREEIRDARIMRLGQELAAAEPGDMFNLDGVPYEEMRAAFIYAERVRGGR